MADKRSMTVVNNSPIYARMEVFISLTGFKALLPAYGNGQGLGVWTTLCAESAFLAQRRRKSKQGKSWMVF